MKELDRIDRHILQVLVADGRAKIKDIADAVGLSPSPCWERIRRLETDGYILGYSAVLDNAKLGAPETVIIEVILERHDDEIFEKFGQAMAALPEVLEVLLTTGEYDYILKVGCAGTAAYEEFLRKKLYKVPGIRHTRSSFTLKHVKQTHAILPAV